MAAAITVVVALIVAPPAFAVRCSDFQTQQEAQTALPANPGLDRDKDGVACEELGSSSSSSARSTALARTGFDGWLLVVAGGACVGACAVALGCARRA
jgi:excalibur calcium-binding domain-containing protein